MNFREWVEVIKRISRGGGGLAEFRVVFGLGVL